MGLRHIEDTLRVGDGLCNRGLVDLTVREGPGHVRQLAEELGVGFDRDGDGSLQSLDGQGRTAESTGPAIARQPALAGNVGH